MPGINPDPGLTLDVKEIIQHFAEESVKATAVVMQETQRKIVEAQSAGEYETREIVLTPGSPAIIAGYDRLRTRMLITRVDSTSTDPVRLGNMTNLTAGTGFAILPLMSPIELKTIDEIYALASGANPVTLSLWMERRR